MSVKINKTCVFPEGPWSMSLFIFFRYGCWRRFEQRGGFSEQQTEEGEKARDD